MDGKNLKFAVCVLGVLAGFSFASPARAAEKTDLEATASSYNEPYNSAHKAVDGDSRTNWVGKANKPNWWIRLDAGKAAYLKRIRIYWNRNRYATNYKIQTSTNSKDWNDILINLNAGGAASALHTINEEARYVRIYIESVSIDYPIIRDIAVFVRKNIPKKLRFQGRLMDKDGIWLDGTYNLTFEIHDRKINGSLLWSERHEGVSIEDGMLDVVLGSVGNGGIDLMFDIPYWLEAIVGEEGGGQEERLAPRFEITSSPYSFNSER